MLIIATHRKVKLYLLSSLLQFGTEEQLRITILAVTQTFLFDMHLNWKPK